MPLKYKHTHTLVHTHTDTYTSTHSHTLIHTLTHKVIHTLAFTHPRTLEPINQRSEAILLLLAPDLVGLYRLPPLSPLFATAPYNSPSLAAATVRAYPLSMRRCVRRPWHLSAYADCAAALLLLLPFRLQCAAVSDDRWHRQREKERERRESEESE